MSEATEILPSVCPLDCPDTCSLSVEVSDGKVTKVRGSHANPFTGGVICNKVSRYYADFVHGDTRLEYPMKRVADGFERITWDEALDLVFEAFQGAIETDGPQSVLPLNYAGPHGELAGGSMDKRFFNRLGASDLLRKPLCGGVRSAAYSSLYGSAPGMPPAQTIHSDLIMIWGLNVTVANLHFTRVLKEARRAGAKVVVIDPKRIKQAQQSDMYLQVRPGTDVVLGLALAAALQARGAWDEAFMDQWVLGADSYLAQAQQYTAQDVAQICGVSVSDFNTLVDWIAEAKTMATAVGVGLERTASGGAGLRAAMALNAVTGQHGRLGAGIVSKAGAAVPKTSDLLQGSHLRKTPARMFNILDAAAVMLDRDMKDPIKAVMVYNHNPVAVHPDQKAMIRALSQPDVFVVGCDVVMTDSMALCDVILPACSHFEHDDIFGAYGQNYLQRAAPVIPPVGEALPNTEIFRRLAARFGFDEPEFLATDRELIDQAIGEIGQRPSELPLDDALEMGGALGADNILCLSVDPATPSGKIELYSEDLAKTFDAGLPKYRPVEKTCAFTLVTPASDKRINATFGGHADCLQQEQLEMHPEDAAQLGLASGSDVILFNEMGEVSATLQISDAMQRGVIYLPKGAWAASSTTGVTVNALISTDARCDLIDGAAYYDTFVDVRAA